MFKRLLPSPLPSILLRRLFLGGIVGCLILVTLVGVLLSRGTGTISHGHHQSSSSPAAAAAVQAGDWPQFGFLPQGGRFNSNETSLTPSNVNQLVLDWTASAPIYYGQDAPVVANGTVYEGAADGRLYAFNAATGAKLWSFQTGGQIFQSAAVANGVVYVGSGDSRLYALDATTGAVLWSYLTGNSINESSPVVANGVVYLAH